MHNFLNIIHFLLLKSINICFIQNLLVSLNIINN